MTTALAPFRASQMLRNALDLGFLATLVSALFFGSDLAWLLVVFAVMPIPIFWRSTDYAGLWHRERRALMSVALYFTYCLICLYAFTGIPADGPQPVNPDAELYLLSLVFLAIGLLRSFQITDLRRKFHDTVPLMLMLAFAALTAYSLMGWTQGCRVFAEAALPFVPALLFSTFSLLLLLDWQSHKRPRQILRLALLSASVAVCVGYTGSRGVSVGLFAVLAGLCVASSIRPLRNQLPHPLEIAAAIALGLGLVALTDALTQCGMVTRLETVSATATSLVQDAPQPAADYSISLRLQMWAAAVDAFWQHPLLGNGLKSEFLFINAPFGHEHAHNQFLSWLSAGGLVFFLLGLLLLLAPVRWSRDGTAANEVVIFAGTASLWGGAMMFDSFLTLDFFLHFYMLLIALVMALRHSKPGAIPC